MSNFTELDAKRVGAILNDSIKPLAERFHALFTLRGIKTPAAVEEISRAFNDESALLKHECAYCLGQMSLKSAVPVLSSVLKDVNQETIVRHEAAEALGAIGDPLSCALLEEFVSDKAREVSETCQLSLARIKWCQRPDVQEDTNPYDSIDPAPPFIEGSVDQWKNQLLDKSLPLFTRYRAMFALRNHGGKLAIEALSSSFDDPSALFKHEIAFVLGQMKDPNAISALNERLSDPAEDSMVRHECAEALGSIATDECLALIEKFRSDPERVVRESCDIALDMIEYEQSGGFQYADSLSTQTS